MDLRSFTAVELGALSDQEVVPLAAELASDYGNQSLEGLVDIVNRLHEGFRRSHDLNRGMRSSLLHLTATLLTVLAVGPRDVALSQVPAHTRSVRVSKVAFRRFQLGQKRAVAFKKETFTSPVEGDVLRLLEVSEQKWTGRDAFAEVLDVEMEGHFFLTSVRPWRGAGTASAEQAIVDQRRESLEGAEEALHHLLRITDPGTPEGKWAKQALWLVERAVEVSCPAEREPVAAE